MNKFKEIAYIVSVITVIAIVICFLAWMIWLAIQCQIDNRKVNINANVAEYIKKLYPGSEIIDISCEYEAEDSDYECKSTIRTVNGVVMAIEVDCYCSCGNWGGCSLDSDSNGGRYEDEDDYDYD